MKRITMTALLLLLVVLVRMPAGVNAQEAANKTKPPAQGVLRQKIPDRLVVLTFDDAVSSHATFVAPLLKKYGFGATFFVTEFPPDFATDKKKYMTWEQIQTLSKMGFEIGNHTHNHTHVTKMNREQFISELEYIEEKCQSLGIPKPVSFAYPGYSTHPSALPVLAEKGYLFARAGWSRAYRPTEDHPFLIPSFSTTGTTRTESSVPCSRRRTGRL